MTFPYLDETKDLDEAARALAGGSFIALPDGVTHYELGGNADGRAVILVHGFSVPYFIFDPTFEFLTSAGFRVLRYDLFGRGFSDRPRVKYDIHLFVRQLKDLLDALRLSQVSLVGLSMGGPITAAFLCAHSQMVRSHVMIDPAGARRVELPAMVKAARVPLLGELALGLLGSGNMVKGIAADLFDKNLVEKFQAQYKVQMQYKGFKRAILSTMRSGMLDSFYETYQAAGKLNKPTLIFWGRQDATIPYEHSALICRAIPHAQLHTVENCGHIPHYEKPAEVHPILAAHLES
ncbi:MAG: alpha/beta fold hydrolase [Anaerolineales bacterium]